MKNAAVKLSRAKHYVRIARTKDMTIQELIDYLSELPTEVRNAPAKVWDSNTGFWYTINGITPFDEDKPVSLENQVDMDIDTTQPEA